MIQIKEKQKCCGCTACYNICPKQAIKMEEDIEGFKYPKVNVDLCIDCSLCEKVCPIKNSTCDNKKVLKSYVVRTKKNNLKEATSGGFFYPLANSILNKNGYVYGVIFDKKDKKIKHIEVNNEDDLRLMNGSKYVQSDLLDIFSKIKKKLNSGKYVLFSGTPCQCEGLKKFLQKNFEKLIMVDVICHGVPSPKLWEKYVDFQEKKYKSSIIDVNFRNKTYGYHSGTMKLVFKNKKIYYGSARVDIMLKSFFKEISSRPSCYKCSFKKEVHETDFTIFDAWNASKLNSQVKEDDKGYTNVFINTEKGKKIFDDISNMYEYYETNYLRAIELDGIMVKNSAVAHPDRKEFYKDLNCNDGIKKIKKNYLKNKITDYIIEKSKKILYKTKILHCVKKLRG